MSLSCPRCGNTLDQDFGLVACLSCGAVCSIDFDGRIQLAESSSSEDLSTSSLDKISAFESPSTVNTTFDSTSDSTFDPTNDPFGDPTVNPTSDSETEALVESSPSDSNPEEESSPVESRGIDESSISSDQSTLLSEQENYADLGLAKQKENFSEVVDFAHSEEVSALSYDLTLDGVTGDELKEKVFTVLAESRLQLDLKKVEQSYKDGTLIIKKLTPAKVSYILHHLLDLPVSPSWRQHIFGS